MFGNSLHGWGAVAAVGAVLISANPVKACGGGGGRGYGYGGAYYGSGYYGGGTHSSYSYGSPVVYGAPRVVYSHGLAGGYGHRAYYAPRPYVTRGYYNHRGAHYRPSFGSSHGGFGGHRTVHGGFSSRH